MTQQELHTELERIQESAIRVQDFIERVKILDLENHNVSKVARAIPFLLKASEKIANQMEGLSVSLYIDQKCGIR